MRVVLYAVSTPHASELLESTRRLGWEVAAAVRNVEQGAVPDEFEAVVDVNGMAASLRSLPFAVPQTGPLARRAAVADALERGFREPVTVVDPTAVVASSAVLGVGVYVGAGVVVGAGAVLGEGCLVNRMSSVAHHVVMGAYVTGGPGAVISGACTVGDGAFLGAGCVLVPEISVGERAVIGAGAVVIRDVQPGQTVVGNPARPV